MKILSGLMAGQVLQRDAQGQGGARISGTCVGPGAVEIRVRKGERVVTGQDWKRAGAVKGKRFEVQLERLRSGGPYRVELRVVDGDQVRAHLTVEDIFVGDVWILGGQSNMEGVGNLSAARKPHPLVRAFYMRDEWGLAEGKLHHLAEAVDRVHNGYGAGPGRPRTAVLQKARASAIKGIGPGHAFGLEMFKRTRVPQGLIACAHGGTSMQQWSPELRDRGGASLYGAMLRRYKKLGQSVAGILWYQGESDANHGDTQVYAERMVHLVEATRRDMALPRLPWVIVQLGRHASRDDGTPWNHIQEQQRCLPEMIRQFDVVPAVDLPLDDGIHISGEGQVVLGKRLARAADRLVHKSRGSKPGIRIDRVELVPTPGIERGSASTAVRVRFKHVAGALQSTGVPCGFSLHDDSGQDTCLIYRTSLEGNAAVLHTNESRMRLETLSLSYGHGRLPACNITDKEDMSLPVIQYMPIASDCPRVCANWQTVFLPDVSSIEKASYRNAGCATGWEIASPRAGFGVLPQPTTSDRTGVFAFRTEIVADAALSALLTFGANCPFKMWLNGKQVLADLRCMTPLNPDQYQVNIKLKAGSNDLLVVFGLAKVATFYGICARIGTLDGKAEPRVR